MPTGYTNGVYRGEITDLKDFAAACARAFNVFAHQRDETLGTALRYPDRDDYYTRMLASALNEQERWDASSEEEKYAEWSQYFADVVAARESRMRSETVVRERYEDMIAQVESVDVPEKMREFKEFMLGQLNDGLKFDCAASGSDSRTGPPPMDYVVWCENTEDRLNDDIGYHSKKAAAYEKRYEEAVEYIDAMAETFGFDVEHP